MEIRTHAAIDPGLCGTVVAMSPGRATVEMETSATMAVDDRGLVHGGFVFGLADHAAMVAVNSPNVVLAAAAVKFTRPVTAGETLVAEAAVDGDEVDVVVRRADDIVMEGTMRCPVLERHVLDRP